MKPRLSISFSGGRSSALMTQLAIDKYRDTHDIIVTFANTGCEHPATLDFVRDCSAHFGWDVVWLEAVISEDLGVGTRHRIVTYETASRNGEPFEAYIRKYGIPNATSQSCTLRLKVDAMDSYRKSLGWVRGKGLNYSTAIGIRYDEMDRMSGQAEAQRLIYPLVEARITKKDVHDFWAKQPFDLMLRGDHYGNCTFCYKKTDRKLYTLMLEAPEVFDFPRRMESLYATHRLESKAAHNGRRVFFRKYRSCDDIEREAHEKVEAGKLVLYRDTLPTPFDRELDLGGGCGESCEVYTDGADADPIEWERKWTGG